jgi:hypothetical protein
MVPLTLRSAAVFAGMWRRAEETVKKRVRLREKRLGAVIWMSGNQFKRPSPGLGERLCRVLFILGAKPSRTPAWRRPRSALGRALENALRGIYMPGSTTKKAQAQR